MRENCKQNDIQAYRENEQTNVDGNLSYFVDLARRTVFCIYWHKTNPSWRRWTVPG